MGDRLRQLRANPLVWALLLDAAAVALVIVSALLVQAWPPREADGASGPGWTMAVIMPLAGMLALVAGAVAVVSLWRVRLVTQAGKWAVGVGLFSALINPVIVLPAYLIERSIRGGEMPGDWGEPYSFVWLASIVVAIILGAVAREPGRRGLLVAPAVIGAFVLTLVIGEFAVPH
jgi:hypothetical protein